MSDTVTISFRGQKHMEKKLAAILRALRWTCIPPGPKWSTPAEVSEEIGIKSNSLNRLINRKDCPRFIADRGESGRINRLVLSDNLRAFLNDHTNPNDPRRKPPTPESARGLL